MLQLLYFTTMADPERRIYDWDKDDTAPFVPLAESGQNDGESTIPPPESQRNSSRYLGAALKAGALLVGFAIVVGAGEIRKSKDAVPACPTPSPAALEATHKLFSGQRDFLAYEPTDEYGMHFHEQA